MPATPPLLEPYLTTATRVAVLVADGVRPSITDQVDDLTPIDATVGCGASRLDTITLRYDLDRANHRLQDTLLPQGFDTFVEIRTANPTTGDLDRVLAFGKLARQPQRIGDSVESVDFIGRLDPFLFGAPFRGYPVKHPVSGDALIVEKDLTFNDQIDKTLTRNMSGQVDAHGAPYVIDPESLRTAASRTLQATSAYRWDLASAVARVCWTLNPAETWIKNPRLIDLITTCGVDQRLLENHTIKMGMTLPEVLDQLLNPFGFAWFVEHTVDTSDATLPATSRIRIFERGAGLEVDLQLQRILPTVPITLHDTTVEDLSMDFEIAQRPNVITGRTGLAKREGTFYCRPAWPKTDDELTKKELADERKEHDREHIDVFAKWVLDTAGDYIGLRDDFPAVIDLEELFEVPTVPVRRRFRPALTLGRDRQPIGENGFLVEWHDGTEFKQVNWSFSVLEHEAGFHFTASVPEEFRTEFLKKARSVSAGSVPPPMVRITCCLEGDTTTSFTAARRPESPNGSNIERLYELDHKFTDARVCSGGDFQSIFYDERHAPITFVNPGTAGLYWMIVAGDRSWLKEGDRIAIVGSTANDGIYHLSSDPILVGGDTHLNVTEAFTDPTVDGTVCLLTDEEAPLTKLTAYVQEIQRREDFAIISASPSLRGLDLPQYEIGVLVPKVSPRNLNLDAHSPASTDSRYPQVMRIGFQFHPEQHTTLTLEDDSRLKLPGEKVRTIRRRK